MNTEQQLRERAEAIVEENFKGLGEFIKDKDILYWYKSLIATCMESFVEQELQRIGEVYQAVSVEDELPPVNEVVDCGKPGDWRAVTFFEKEGMRQIFHDYDITHWLKKLSLLEVKDGVDKIS